MTTSFDVRAALLSHKDSPRDDWRQGDRAASSMPWPERPEPSELVWNIRTASEIEAERLSKKFQTRDTSALDTKALKPLYTAKLPASPRFPSLAQAAQRRRDFWTKVIARGSLGLVVGAGVVASWIGTGAAFKAFGVIGGAGLIIFIATCAYAARRNRNRVP